jgi:hypothetical protein
MDNRRTPPADRIVAARLIVAQVFDPRREPSPGAVANQQHGARAAAGRRSQDVIDSEVADAPVTEREL